MSGFEIGDRIVCFDIGAGPWDEMQPLRKGRVYTVRAFRRWFPRYAGVYLVEILNPSTETWEGYAERYYDVAHFTPLRKTTDIRPLEALLTATPEARRAFFKERAEEVAKALRGEL